jgi:hypothetical protein
VIGADEPAELLLEFFDIRTLNEPSSLKGTLDGRTLPLCFWNAFFGRHVEVLQTLGHLIMTLPPGQVQSLEKAMAEQKEKFTEGAVKNNISKKIAEEIFEAIDKFANYGFNKRGWSF